MKTYIILIALTTTLFASGCLQSDDISENPFNHSAVIEGSQWVITYFWDSDHEETAHYSGFVFAFEDGGVLKATQGPASYTGTWQEGTDDSTPKLYLHFSTPPDLEELSDDWHILEINANRIRLEDVSGGNGGTDLLTFEKI